MHAFINDFTFGLRSLLKRPGSAIISVLVLSVGIGLSTFMFSIVYGIWLRGLEVPGADRLTLVWETNLAEDVPQRRTPVHDLWAWREQAQSFSGLFGWYSGTTNLSSDGADPERFSGAFVTTNFFDVLQVQPVLGRAFREGEDAPGMPLTTVVSHEMWQNRFGGAPDILGRTIKVNGEQATVIGVMGEGERFPNGEDMWVPMREIPSQVDRGERPLAVMGRLADGVTLEQAELELASIAEGLAREFPETNEGIGIRFMTWSAWQTPMSFGSVFIVMMVSVVFVLLVACANVANLLLARATLRVKEAAVRSALGGRRMRVVLPFFAEAVLLALGSAVVGTAIAFGAVEGFDAVTRQFRPFWIEFAVDFPALAFVLGTTLFVSVAAGALPAYQIARADVNAILKDEARGSSSMRLGRVSKILVVGEVALSCALLVGSGLMAKNMLQVNRVDFPYDIERVFTARLVLFPTGYPTPESRSQFFTNLEERLAGHPQIARAALTTGLPGTGSSAGRTVSIEGMEYASDQDRPRLLQTSVSPGFFSTLDVALLQGRTFTADDRSDRPKVAIVNQWFAQRHFPDGAMGRRFKEGGDADAPWITVVGVAPDLNLGPIGVVGDSAGYYTPLAQADVQFASIMATPEGGDPLALTEAVRGIVRALDDDLPIFNVGTLESFYDQFTFFIGIFGTLFIIFGAVTLAIALVGLYGVLSFSVSRRLKEMGVRIALGAQGRDIMKLIVRQGLIQMGIGMVLGLGGGFAVSNVLSNFLFGVDPRDPSVFVGVSLTVLAVGVFATWLPARRASEADPLVALRAE